jgi:hypothetical protein
MVAGVPVSWSCTDGEKYTPACSANVPPTVKTDAAIKLIPTHRRITCFIVFSSLEVSRKLMIET